MSLASDKKSWISSILQKGLLFLFFVFHFLGMFLLDIHNPVLSIILFLISGICAISSMILSCNKKINSPPNINQQTNRKEQNNDVLESC